jgi:hypothetical protein
MKTYERVFSRCKRQVVGHCEYVKQKHIDSIRKALKEIKKELQDG